jgi:hypothetical protein
MLCKGFELHEPVLRQLNTLRAVSVIDGENSDRPYYKSRLLAAVSGDIPSPSSTLTHCSWRTLTSLNTNITSHNTDAVNTTSVLEIQPYRTNTNTDAS